MQYLPKHFTSKAIWLYILALLSCSLLFRNYALPLIWVVFGLITVVAFFYFSNLLTLKWSNLPEKAFKKKVFRTALVIRLVYVVAIYFFYQSMTGEPFEFSAADSIGYHQSAIWVTGLFNANRVGEFFQYMGKNYSVMVFHRTICGVII